MSFTEPDQRLAPEHDRPELRGPESIARRRERHRRRAARRRDGALGVLIAIVGILIAPGFALVGIFAVAVLIVVGFSLLYQRWHARRTTLHARRPRRRRGPPR
jgi:hypothetical protein